MVRGLERRLFLTDSALGVFDYSHNDEMATQRNMARQELDNFTCIKATKASYLFGKAGGDKWSK